ncbi:agmatinase [archaeon]|nr:agmatinase [archaeon]
MGSVSATKGKQEAIDSGHGGVQVHPDLDYFLFLPFAFMGSQEPLDKARVVFFGIPLDATTSYKPGTRWGPNAAREASLEIDSYIPELGKAAYSKVETCDIGNVWVSPGNMKETLERIAELNRRLIGMGKIPFALGGEHTGTAGLTKPFAEREKDLVLVYFDAHADLREEYKGDKINHTSSCRLAIENGIKPRNVFQIGIRSLSQDEHEYIKKNRVGVAYSTDIHYNLRRVCSDLEKFTRNKKVYVSFDLDAVDGALVPATGTPEPGGISFDEACSLIASVKGRVVGCDMMEIARDEYMLTPSVASKLIYRMLAYFDFG